MRKIIFIFIALLALAWPSVDPSKFSPSFVDQLYAKDSGKDDNPNDGNNGKGNDDKDKDTKDPPTVPEPSSALQYGAGAVVLAGLAYFLSKKPRKA